VRPYAPGAPSTHYRPISGQQEPWHAHDRDEFITTRSRSSQPARNLARRLATRAAPLPSPKRIGHSILEVASMRRNWHWVGGLGLTLALLAPGAALLAPRPAMAEDLPTNTVVSNDLISLGVGNDGGIAVTSTAIRADQCRRTGAPVRLFWLEPGPRQRATDPNAREFHVHGSRSAVEHVGSGHRRRSTSRGS
jgi:hypothetical protein